MSGRWQRGQSLPGLPADLYDLFPDTLIPSELGQIPQGWRVSTIGDDFNLTMGQSPPGSSYNEAGDGLPFFQGCKDFGFRYPITRVFCTMPKRLAKPGDTLVSVRAPVGDVNMAKEKCIIGRGVAALRHKSGSRSYTYYAMLHLRQRFQKFEDDGTVFGAISSKQFQSLIWYVAPSALVTEFETRASPLDERIAQNTEQSRTLAALRDALLPELISGRLRLADAERFLQARGL
jgi:type I restriction enzyme S subunit